MFHDFVDEVWALENQVGSQGRIQDFKLGGEHLKKLRRAEGGGKFLGYFVWKITILR